MIHINRYDTISIWCGGETWPSGDPSWEIEGCGEPGNPEEGTCKACLVAIVEYGERAKRRLEALK